jgi:glycosyltransferase involved in cell wall biosynthesis
MTDAALVMIVKNEERCIQRCLESARPFVGKMVVVDTGSTDATVGLCRDAGAQVHHFEWCDDFSAARNYALEMADSDWNLVLDADEWIASDCLIEQRELEAPFLGLIKILNVSEIGDQSQTTVNWMPRWLPRGVRYEGLVHEQPISDLPKKRLNLLVHHDGYSNLVSSSKNGRNKRLLLRALEATPSDPYILYQLGVDDEINRNYAGAAVLYERAHAFMKQEYSYKRALIVRWMHCLSQAKRTQEAIALIERYQFVYKDDPDFFFTAGNVFLDHAMQDPERALNMWLPLAVQSWEACLDIGEKPDLEGAVIGRGSFLAAKNLHAVYSILGDRKRADHYLSLAGRRSLV